MNEEKDEILRHSVTLSSLMTTVFSTSGEDAITRVLHVQQDLSSDNDFEIQRTVHEIITGNYKRVKRPS